MFFVEHSGCRARIDRISHLFRFLRWDPFNEKMWQLKFDGNYPGRENTFCGSCDSPVRTHRRRLSKIVIERWCIYVCVSWSLGLRKHIAVHHVWSCRYVGIFQFWHQSNQSMEVNLSHGFGWNCALTNKSGSNTLVHAQVNVRASDNSFVSQWPRQFRICVCWIMAALRLAKATMVRTIAILFVKTAHRWMCYN